MDGHEVLTALLPGLGDQSLSDRDVLEPVDLALGPQAIAVALEHRRHLGSEQRRHARHAPRHPRALHLEEDVRGGLPEHAGIEARVHLADVAQPTLEVRRAGRGLHRAGAACALVAGGRRGPVAAGRRVARGGGRLLSPHVGEGEPGEPADDHDLEQADPSPARMTEQQPAEEAAEHKPPSMPPQPGREGPGC